MPTPPLRVAYFDPVAGAAGDMINAALLDAGADLSIVQAAIASLDIAGLQVNTEAVMKGAIGALAFHVSADADRVPDHLTPPDLIQLAQHAVVSDRVRQQACNIINCLAEAEAHVHRVAPEQVHFHELGGLDTIVDILGALVSLENLSISACYTGPLPMNGGTWGVAHGALPLPMPATLEIIARGNLSVVAAHPSIPRDKELVTPTGAAILAELAMPGLPSMTVERVGYGAGTRDLPVPNVIRVWIGTLDKASMLTEHHD